MKTTKSKMSKTLGKEKYRKEITVGAKQGLNSYMQGGLGVQEE